MSRNKYKYSKKRHVWELLACQYMYEVSSDYKIYTNW